MPTVAREITLRFLAAPTDAGFSGSVSGGRVLEWIDKAGYACAVGWAGTYSVTAYVGNVRFSRPVKVGDLVEATAQLIHTGRSSMHILVTVSSGNARDRLLTEATKCLMIFVAMGPEGRSTPVPPWQPITDEDREQQASAQRRVALRADIEAAMAAQQYTDEGTAPALVLRFLAAPTDINWGGKVHGGIVMRWIDETAHLLASRWTANTANVAVYAGGVRFYQPLLIGHLVEVDARAAVDQSQQYAHQRPRSLRRRHFPRPSADHPLFDRVRAGRLQESHPMLESGLGGGQGTRGTRLASHPVTSPRRFLIHLLRESVGPVH
jgi:acyl-CoA hydrolase